jgi:hypothetical protein
MKQQLIESLIIIGLGIVAGIIVIPVGVSLGSGRMCAVLCVPMLWGMVMGWVLAKKL